ncbi:putative sporozoite surface protein, partial [Operophtera brumata]
MNSALKPVLASAGVPQPAGQSSPAKGNVPNVNHASVGHPQGAQNSLNHGTSSNNLAVQNLTQHVPAPQVPPHAVPSMAPVTPNMAQMAQVMSNHGNLSHVNQNSGPAAPVVAASPSKAPSTSSPLSLVAEKANASQPLALTRSTDKPEKKEPDSTGQPNGTVDSPKSASNTPVTLKALNPEANKDKLDIAKTSPSTTKPPEKPLTAPSTPQKPESANPATPAGVPTQAKMAPTTEPSEKTPSKPAEPKPAPIVDVAPTQSDSKPVPEAKNSEPSPPEKEKAPTPPKQEPRAETPKTEPVKAEEKKEVPEKPSTEEKPKEEIKEKPEALKDTVDPLVKVVEKEKVEPKKFEPKKEPKPKSTLKLATVTPPLRKRRQASPAKGGDGPTPAKKAAEESTPDARTKRNRTK